MSSFVTLKIFSWILLAKKKNGSVACNTDVLSGRSFVAVLDMSVEVFTMAYGGDTPSREDGDTDGGERPARDGAAENGSAAGHGESLVGGGSSELNEEFHRAVEVPSASTDEGYEGA